MTKDILIWGAGAIGGTIGAYLKRAGYDVTFVDVVTDHVEAIRTPLQGLAITGPVDAFTMTAPAFTPEELTGRYSRIFLCVKAQHTVGACETLLPFLADDGYVLSLQNGLCERYIAETVGVARTVGAFVNFGADWHGPGEILYGNRGAVVLGEIDGKQTPRLERLLADMRHFEPDAIATADIWSFLWGKLGYGALLHAQAIGNLGIADCLARPELLPLWKRIGSEVMRVAQAERITPQGFNGFDPAAFETQASDEQLQATVDAMVAFNRPNAKTHSGIWRDLAVRKRKTEVDMQVGEVVRIGAVHRIATPTLGALQHLIHEIEDGRRPLSDDNLLALL
ncbi:ketopantoate reductase family protein [Robbsia sp. Bb-Pol-6]|uniref:2-dehydropantoate 2-reductase n=1 Tax=Robbsia betulipollinis TaxID=2981849 RepID=A0ABT3ZLJ6_9BURK|nr:2-dehydropantoate 2-reductase N-terminal domain-containing protein [Robbsia betulipollinis]MCY0386825.1 ketopantoate reductase family protein [Robbsia betulipollinis]